MTQISHKKHTGKKPVPDLFPASKGSRPLDNSFATAAQLAPYTGMDDAALRRRAREMNPSTSRPWIPAARGSKWPVAPTLSGVAAWYRHQISAAETRGLPAQCASMRDVEALLGLSVAAQQYARTHHHPAPGAPVIFEASNRVNLLPLLRFFSPLLNKLSAGGGAQIKDLEAFQDLDVDFQRAKCLQQDEIEKRRNNALANEDLNTRDGLEKEIAEPLTAIFSALKNYEKITGNKLKSLCAGAGIDPDLIRQIISTAAAGVTDPMTKLREQLKLDTAPVLPSKELKKAA